MVCDGTPTTQALNARPPLRPECRTYQEFFVFSARVRTRNLTRVCSWAHNLALTGMCFVLALPSWFSSGMSATHLGSPFIQDRPVLVLSGSVLRSFRSWGQHLGCRIRRGLVPGRAGCGATPGELIDAVGFVWSMFCGIK